MRRRAMDIASALTAPLRWTANRSAATRAVPVFGLSLLLLAALPEAAHACPVCFDARDENRQAFLATTVFLSLFPLGMVAGVGLWVRKRSKELDEREAAERTALNAGDDAGA